MSLCHCWYDIGKTGLQQACVVAVTPIVVVAVIQACCKPVLPMSYGHTCVFFIQVCSGPTSVHCNTVLCRMHSPVLSAALQDRLAAGLCRCNYPCEYLLFIQVCNGPTPVHCNTVFCKMQSPLLSAALQDRLATGLCRCSYPNEDLRGQ